MVCSRCAQQGHRRDNHRCPLFNGEMHDTYTSSVAQRRALVRRSVVQEVEPVQPEQIEESKQRKHIKKLRQIHKNCHKLMGVATRWVSVCYFVHGSINENLLYNLKNIYNVSSNSLPLLRNRLREPTVENLRTVNMLNKRVAIKYNEIVSITRSRFNEEFSDFIIENCLTPLTRTIRLHSFDIRRVLEVSVSSIVDLTYYHFECGICFEEKEQNTICTFNCSHKFCSGCVCGLINSRKTILDRPIPCPLCRVDVNRVISNSEECKTQIETHL